MTKLEEYIKKARASGYDDITIKDNLKKAGWPEENIEPFLKKDESEDRDSFIQPKKEDTVVIK